MIRLNSRVRVVNAEAFGQNASRLFVGREGVLITVNTAVDAQLPYQVLLDEEVKFGRKYWFAGDELEEIAPPSYERSGGS